jgi:hypothetical protein
VPSGRSWPDRDCPRSEVLSMSLIDPFLIGLERLQKRGLKPIGSCAVLGVSRHGSADRESITIPTAVVPLRVNGGIVVF